MARKKINKDETIQTVMDMDSEQVEGSAPPEFLQQLMEAGQKKFGERGVFVGTSSKVVGLEPYSIALQYLMDLEVIPLQAIISLAGEAKSYKTSALLEICKLAMTALPVSGMGTIANTEGKWSHSKARSQLGALSNRLIVHQCTSVEEWQDIGTSYLSTMKDAMAKKKEAKTSKTKDSKYRDLVIPPVIFGIDSLTGAQSTAVQDDVMKDGHGKKTFQDRATVNWQWLNTWGSNLLGIPATVVVVQHLKDKIDSSGIPGQKVTGGGSGTGFMCSMEIRMKNIGDISTVKYEGCFVQWTMHFNSLGRDKRRIRIPYIETYDDNDEQLAFFDWDAALTDLLMKTLTEGSAEMKARVIEVVGEMKEYPKPGGGKVYSCLSLGIDKEKALEDGLDATEIGKLLQTSEEMREKLKKAYRIQRCEKWTPESL